MLETLKIHSLNTILIFLLGGCTLFGPSQISYTKSQSYYMKMNLKNWIEIDSSDSDMAFTQIESGSIILVNSVCDRYQDTPIKVLANNLLSEIKRPKVEKRESLEFKGMDSIRLQASGTIEESSIKLFTQTSRAQSCVYDFILINTNSNYFETDKQDFLTFIESFKGK